MWRLDGQAKSYIVGSWPDIAQMNWEQVKERALKLFFTRPMQEKKIKEVSNIVKSSKETMLSYLIRVDKAFRMCSLSKDGLFTNRQKIKILLGGVPENLRSIMVRDEALYNDDYEKAKDRLILIEAESQYSKEIGREETSVNVVNSDLHCFKCNGIGHFARDCKSVPIQIPDHGVWVTTLIPTRKILNLFQRKLFKRKI